MTIEHPSITEMERVGTCEEYRNYYGLSNSKAIEYVSMETDYFGDLFNLETDHYVETREGHYVLERNLLRYLEEVLGMDANFVY